MESRALCMSNTIHKVLQPHDLLCLISVQAVLDIMYSHLSGDYYRCTLLVKFSNATSPDIVL